MNRNDIVDSLGRIDEEMINEVDEVRGRYKVIEKKKPSPAWRKITALAACLLLVVGGVGHFFSIHGGMGSSGGGSQSGEEYMYYAGPVLPLTTAEEIPGIRAERHINYDFSDYDSYMTENSELGNELCRVSDKYVLTNDSKDDVTFDLYYPFVAALADSDLVPEVKVAGESVETILRAGPVSEKLADDSDYRTLISDIYSWEDFRNVLDREYLEKALADHPIPDEKVIVYELYDMYGDESDEAEAPTIAIEFTSDLANRKVLSYGFNGWEGDSVKGINNYNVFVPQYEWPGHEAKAYLIVIGEDLDDYQIKAYTDGGLGKEMDNAGAKVKRYECTFGDILKITCAEFLESYIYMDYGNNEHGSLDIDLEEFAGLVSEIIDDYGLLSDSPSDYFDTEDLTEVYGSALGVRVIYQCFSVTVPAEGSLEISLDMVKLPSRDFKGNDLARNGYDMLTKAGSKLLFDSQTASVSGTEYIYIIDQNFGFDLGKGVNEAALDPGTEHYFIDIGRLGEGGEPMTVPGGVRRSPMVMVFNIMFFAGLIGLIAAVFSSLRKI
ncbi:MAG: hypothetical protein IKS99_08060 [Firmicutes bacterium]|nr:hypothetical protein [Bacillota bacterium]